MSYCPPVDRIMLGTLDYASAAEERDAIRAVQQIATTHPLTLAQFVGAAIRNLHSVDREDGSFGKAWNHLDTLELLG